MEVLANVLQTVQSGQVSSTPSHHVTCANRSGLSAKLGMRGGANVGAAVAISRWVSVTAGVTIGVIIIAALLAIGVVGAMQLRNDDRLAGDNFLKLMIESFKRLSLLSGKDELNKNEWNSRLDE